MEWNDQGIILSYKRHGENGLLLCIFSENHGKIKGYMRGIKQNLPNIQSGNFVSIKWRGRTDDHLGNLTIESLNSVNYELFNHASKMNAWLSLAAVLEWALPEKMPMHALYNDLLHFMNSLESKNWLQNYVTLEYNLLIYMGYGLDFTKCAVSGVAENLSYVSPKTGRAVTEEFGDPYKEKLFKLPMFMRTDYKGAAASVECLKNGLIITGYFIEKYILSQYDRAMPEQRKTMEHKLQCA